ncbi:hypothetical protein [Pseudoroseomonas sp. WGS1072]|uniref:hypothetical protein n=1 Tax=Roseomonas sp. WGS1072 TaxID=3366816 RepID=UPI003BF2FBC7
MIAAALAPVAAAPSVILGNSHHDHLPHADAELIRLCGAYIEALDAYTDSGSQLDCEDDPLWQAIEALEEQLDGLTARTLDGVAALGRVAQRWALQQDGSENFDTSFTGDWPERVVRNVLRLQAEGRA